jgi:hypothetical protein
MLPVTAPPSSGSSARAGGAATPRDRRSGYGSRFPGQTMKSGIAAGTIELTNSMTKSSPAW